MFMRPCDSHARGRQHEQERDPGVGGCELLVLSLQSPQKSKTVLKKKKAQPMTCPPLSLILPSMPMFSLTSSFLNHLPSGFQARGSSWYDTSSLAGFLSSWVLWSMKEKD